MIYLAHIVLKIILIIDQMMTQFVTFHQKCLCTSNQLNDDKKEPIIFKDWYFFLKYFIDLFAVFLQFFDISLLEFASKKFYQLNKRNHGAKLMQQPIEIGH